MPASSLITSQLHTFITLIPIQRTHTHRCYCTQTTPQPNLGLSKHANEASWADQGSLQCALMINNPVGISVAHITTKHNVIADRISRIKRKTNTIPEFSSLLQDFPQLKSCKRFHPSNELISLIMDILLQKNIIDPLAASRQLLSDLDKTFMMGTHPR